jgi:hypothetical protein
MVRSSNTKSDFEGDITYDNPNPEYLAWIRTCNVYMYVHASVMRIHTHVFICTHGPSTFVLQSMITVRLPGYRQT